MRTRVFADAPWRASAAMLLPRRDTLFDAACSDVTTPLRAIFATALYFFCQRH